MVQMMQIQGMRYGVENSLKPSLQEVSLKIVVCAENRQKKKKDSEPESKITLFLPCEWNSQSSFQTRPCTFSALSCYPQTNKVNKMFVLLAHQAQEVREDVGFPAEAVTCCPWQQLVELPL